MKMDLKLKDIISWIEGDVELKGSEDVLVEGFASIDISKKGDLTFIQDKKYLKQAVTCEAAVLLVPSSLEVNAPNVDVVISCENPSKALSEICGVLERSLYPVEYSGINKLTDLHSSVKTGEKVSIGAFSVVGENAILGDCTSLGSGVSIGSDVVIGNNVKIHDNAVIAPHTIIGDGVIIHSGVVIGTSGFGYDFNKLTGRHEPIPQIGRVVIGKNVDVGANTTIDRARFGDTVIGEGSKIDNQVQIGHNVRMGKHCIVCAQVGISGTVEIGDYVVLAGQVGVADHVSLANGTQVGGGAGITSSIKEPGSKLWGTPAMDYGLAVKVAILQKKIPDLFKRFKEVEKQLDIAKK